jgi:hypothetical protein
MLRPKELIPELCRGCAISSDGTGCDFHPTYKGLQCPCTTCLVKATCLSTVNECEKYFEYLTQCDELDREER